MKYFLMGYMGSGKSTIGPLLAEALSYKFLDFDTYIEEAEGNSISEIFKNKGEIYFRKAETRHLKALIDENDDDIVVALGGGTPCYGNNLELIKEANAKTMYLNWNFKVLANRLWEAKEERPLIASMQSLEDLEDYIRKHLFERGFYYNQADVVIKVETQLPEELTAEILEKLL
ncbi:shikimate kinase [Dokdonia sp. Asnod1-B02]|uniref:shikimate kinase n=1 Tax=Dokdonia sp. Asnod1-B02 TaxID=3160573 RepID=UPI003865521B